MTTIPHSEERLARAALTRIFEPADALGHRLIAEHGAHAALLIAIGARPAPSYQDVTDEELAAGLRRWEACDPHTRPEEDLFGIERLGGGFLIPGDEHWPAALDDLDDPPIGLWYRGDISHGIPGPEECVAVVGSRDCTSYGASVAGEIAIGLAEQGITVASGLMYGVDAQSHRAALAGMKDGRPATIAVVACGLDRDYPSGNADLAAAIRSHGLTLSELAPGCCPSRSRLQARARIIAALAGVTCVVEARTRSGALDVARAAKQLGRDVAAVSGSIHSANSAGCHQMIKDGTAALITDVEDLIGMIALEPDPRG
jgi:DNA processing protein